MTVIVAVVRSFHTIHKLIVCLFLARQHVRNQQKHQNPIATYMCGVGVDIMVSRLDVLDRLNLKDWRWERVLDLVVAVSYTHLRAHET